MILGEKTRWISDFVLATASFCSGLGYAAAPMELMQSIVCEEKISVLCNLTTNGWPFYTFLMFLVTIPMLHIEDFRRFKYANMACLFFQIALMGTSVWILYNEDLTKMKDVYDPNPRIMYSMHRFLKLYGLTCFGIESVPLMFPIMGKMKKKEGFNKLFYTVTAVVTISACLASILIYSVMGTNIDYIYLVDLISHFRSIRILLGIYSFFLFLNMSYMFYPAYQILVLEYGIFSKTFHVIPIKLSMKNF